MFNDIVGDLGVDVRLTVGRSLRSGNGLSLRRLHLHFVALHGLDVVVEAIKSGFQRIDDLRDGLLLFRQFVALQLGRFVFAQNVLQNLIGIDPVARSPLRNR